MDLLSKFLLIAKSCYEQRNFATAMQILGALEHLAVRQAPVSRRAGREGWAGPRPGVSPALSFQAWRILPAKTAEVMEELKAVEVRRSMWASAAHVHRGFSPTTDPHTLCHSALSVTHGAARLAWPHPLPKGPLPRVAMKL